MPAIEIYTKNWCPYCARAKALLQSLGLDYREFDVTSDAILEREMVARAKRTSVPQIFVGEHHLGGSDDLAAAVAEGELDHLLSDSDVATVNDQETEHESARR